MNKQRISIIVPIYNAEEYLRTCIESLITQKYKNIEIVLVDDGSSDNSLQICHKYGKQDKRIKVIHTNNRGVSSARNTGIKEATGEWITFVDADDWVENDYINSMYEVIDDDTDFVIGRTIAVKNEKEVYDGYKGKEIESFSNDKKNELLYSIFNDNIKRIKYPHISTCSAKLIRKELILKNDICYDKNLKYYEDAVFNIEIICKSRKVKIIDKKIYKYRQNDNSSTKKYDGNSIDYYDRVYQKLREIEKNYNLDFSKLINVFKIKNLNIIIGNYLKSGDNIKMSTKFIKDLCKKDSYAEAIKKVDIKQLPKRRKALVLLSRLKLYFLITQIYKI